MNTVSIAVSLEKPLLERIDEVARELGVVRGEILARAVAEFVGRYENARLLARLNEGHGGEPSHEESTLARARRRAHRRLLRRES